MDFWLILFTTIVAMLAVATLLRPKPRAKTDRGLSEGSVNREEKTTQNSSETQRSNDKEEATDAAGENKSVGEQVAKEEQKKDKKKEKIELDEPPEVIAARKEQEQMCSGCPFPCHDHAWLPDNLQSKIKWAPLAGNVKTYKKHLLLCSGISSAAWPPDVEEDPTSFPAQLSASIKANKAAIGYSVKLTVCDLPSEGREGIDIIIFPSMIKILQVTEENIPFVVQKLLVENVHPKDAGLRYEPTDFKSCIMVCAHKQRDKRCGIAGPLLAKEFNKQCAERHLNDVAIVEVSHTGGHKYAGNIIVYPSGHWYGRVTTCHVSSLLDLHFSDSPSPSAFSDFPLSRGSSGCVKDVEDW